MKLNKRSVVLTLCSAIVIGAGLFAITAAITDRGTIRPGADTPRRSHAADATSESRSGALFRLLPRLLGDSESSRSETAESDVDAGLRNRARMMANGTDVVEEASRFRLPYKNETERQDVLRRLKETELFFEETISSVEDRIMEARTAGSRTPEEIAEAEEALSDIKKGRRFIAERMKLVEKNPIQSKHGEGSE